MITPERRSLWPCLPLCPIPRSNKIEPYSRCFPLSYASVAASNKGLKGDRAPVGPSPPTAAAAGMGPGPPPQRPPLGPPVRQGSSGAGSSRRLSGAAGIVSPSPRTALSDTRPPSGSDGRGSTLPPSPGRRQPTPPSNGHHAMTNSPGATSTLPDLGRLSLTGSSSNGMGLSRSGSGSRGRGAMAGSPAGPVRPTEPIVLSDGQTSGPRVRRGSRTRSGELTSSTTAQLHEGPSPLHNSGRVGSSSTGTRDPTRPPSPRLLPSLSPSPLSPSLPTSLSPSLTAAPPHTRTPSHSKALVPYSSGTQVDAAGRLLTPHPPSQPPPPQGGGDALSGSGGGGGRVPSPEVRRLVGLQNLGNTCFMNSCLQCLLSAKSLTRWLCEGRHESQVCAGSPLKGQLVQAYAQLAHAACHAQDHTAISPAALKKVVGKWAPHFSGYEQQDSQEFLRFLMDGLSEDLNRATTEQRQRAKQQIEAANRAASVPLLTLEVGEVRRQGEEAWARHLLNNNSVITDLFCGQLQSRVQCGVCQRSTLCFDAIMDISLSLPKGSEVLETRGRSRAATPQAPTPLAHCFDTFTQQETLDGDERVRCEHCKTQCKGFKTLTIQRFPPLLVLHIKRFRYTTYAREKLATPLDFPLTGLDLRPYAAPGYTCTGNALPPIYDLYAVSNHIGGMGGGHYTAHCRYGSQWYSFNDASVSSVSPSQLSGAQAYLLFYAQRTTPNAAL